MTSVTSELLQGLLSSDASIRSQAEAVYQNLNVLERITGLVPYLNPRTTNEPGHASSMLAAVLLRRDIVKLTSGQHLQELIPPLLQALEFNDKVGHCVAEICSSLTLVQPDIVSGALTTILTHIQGPCQTGNVTSLQLLASLADKAPVAFSQLAAHSLVTLYQPGWSPAALAAWMHVILKAAIASTVNNNTEFAMDGHNTAIVANLDDLRVEPTSAAAMLSQCLLPILEWVSSTPPLLMATDYHDDTLAMLHDLQHACVTVPSLVASNPSVLGSIVQACLQLATAMTTNGHFDLSLAALQVLSSLVSVGDVKRRFFTPEMASAIASQALPLCAQILVAHAGDEIDDQGWADEPAMLHDCGMDDDEDDEYLFALSLLNDFMVSLGVLGHVLPLAEQLLSSHPRVGLSVVGAAVTAAPVGLTQHLAVVLQASTALATSPNPRIQYQALGVLGTLCETHAEHIPADTVHVILERLASGIGSKCSKLSTTASLALVSVARSPILAEYLPPILPQLLQVLIQGPLSLQGTDTGSLAVRIRAIGATATVAQACGGDTFAPFYSQIMQGLVPMIVATTNGSIIDLAGASLEAATIIGQAVGKELFAQDAHQLLQWMMPQLQQQQSTTTSGSFTETILLACARIASVLEDDFVPYVHVVVPLLLQRVQEAPEVSVVEGNEGSQENSDDIIGTESVTVALPGRGFTKVSINTTKIQEQAQAARALYEHAKAMGASFPYIQQSMDALLPLVNFPYSSDVRSTCAQTLAAVMEAACLVGDEQGNMGPVRTYLPLVTQAIAKQIPLEDGTTDMEALIALADSLSEIYHIIYSNRKAHPEILIDFGLANAEQSVQSCIATLTSCLERRSQITAVLSGALTGEDEQHDYAQLLEAEQQLLTPLVDSIGYTLKFHGSAFLPIFEKYVLPVLGSKMENQSDVRATLSAVCLFDDVVEHCGPDAAANYAPRLMQAIATALEKHADEKELVQASVYGIAQMARHAPSGVLSGHLEAIIHRLLALTSRSKDDAGDDVYLLEMAASALAAVTLLGPFPDVKFAPKDRLVDSFLSHLPILQDDDEAKICHAGLCHLIESGVISLSQESVRVAKVIGTVLVQVHEGEDVASPDTIERLSSILFQMQQSLPPSTLQQAFVSMEPEAQQIASSILQEMGVSRSHIVTP